MAKQEQKAAQAEATTEEQPLIEQIMDLTSYQQSDENYEVAEKGLKEFLRHMIIDRRDDMPKVKQGVVNEMIAQLDERLSAQVSEILHHEQFQKLESAWRGLKMVVDRTNFRENIKIEILNVSKEDLLSDFDSAPEIVKSGLYRTVYSQNYGVFGGEPVAGMIANYEFGPGPQDIALLQFCAAVGTMSHAPFIAGAGPQFFGQEDFLDLPNLKDLDAMFDGPQYAKWKSFRESEDSRYVGLAMPRFLLRLPYGSETIPVKDFDFEEQVSDDHERYLWGNASYAFASRLTDSFAKYRFCTNIVGPRGGGAVEDLPVHVFESMGSLQNKIPTEILLTERREYELSEQGFMGLTMRKGSDNACFFSANSVQKPKFFGQDKEGKAAEANYKLGTRLPYMFIVNRLSHYLKVLQREEIGSTKSRMDLEQDLNTWIGQYVLDMDTAKPAQYAKRPLRAASVVVEDIEGDPGWYKVSLKVKPHFKYEGAFFELSLVGKIGEAAS